MNFNPSPAQRRMFAEEITSDIGRIIYTKDITIKFGHIEKR